MHPGDAPDEELVSRFLRLRDEEAFRLLFRRYSPRLYAMARRLMGADFARDADDVVQEAWLRAAGRLPQFEWRSSLSTWLQSIVINCARERLRKRMPEPADESAIARRAGSTTAREPLVDLERAIAELPPGYREVLVLHDVYGYTHAEIGALVGVTDGTSKSQLFHARRAIRERLGGRPSGADHD